jgi:hypothetical protein
MAFDYPLDIFKLPEIFNFATKCLNTRKSLAVIINIDICVVAINV